MNDSRCDDRDVNQRIIEKLIKLRHERKKTQYVVRIETGETNIGRIESGKHRITITTLKRLCDYYGVKMSELLDDIGE